MKVLRYKGIIFDDWARDNHGLWAEMCAECAAKYEKTVADDLDDGTAAAGICSVYGCGNRGTRDDKKHYYIDFKSGAEILNSVVFTLRDHSTGRTYHVFGESWHTLDHVWMCQRSVLSTGVYYTITDAYGNSKTFIKGRLK